MTDDNDNSNSESIAALRDRRESLGGDRSALSDALDRQIEESERELDETRELTELKLTLAEAEEAGLEDDPAVSRLRERIEDMEDALGITNPEEEAEERAAALRAARDSPTVRGNDRLAERFDEKLGEAETEAAIATSEDEKIASLSECETPAERAQARIRHAKGKMDDDAREELRTQEFGLGLLTSMHGMDQYDSDMCQAGRQNAQEKIAALCKNEAGVPIPELERGA